MHIENFYTKNDGIRNLRQDMEHSLQKIKLISWSMEKEDLILRDGPVYTDADHKLWEQYL